MDILLKWLLERKIEIKKRTKLKNASKRDKKKKSVLGV